MRKKILVLLTAATVFTGFAAGQIYYEIDADENQLLMNSTVKMSCDTAMDNCPVSVWTLTLNKPESSEVLNVNSSFGDVKRYNVRGDQITIEVSSEQPQSSVAIMINYRIDDKAKEIKDGLYYRQIGLPGFSGEKNYGTIDADNLINGGVSYGFRSSIGERALNFTGSAPSNAWINFGEGYETDYYEFFGAEPESSEKAYEISVGTTGVVQRFERFPVALLDNTKYNETVNRWSSGQYINGKLVLREDLKKDFLPVLAHETVHGLNAEAMAWDQTESAYIDEGTSKYIEFLVRKTEISHPTRELFGEEVSYIREKNGNRYRYTLPPKGSKEALWQYYENDREFMKRWSSSTGNRDFGYAYSELIIRNYVANMNGSVSQLYSELKRDDAVDSNNKKWEYYSQLVDLTPCKYESRERFESCLETINEYDYPVYSASPERTGSTSLKVEKLEVPEQKTSDSGYSGSGNATRIKSGSSLLEEFFTALGRFVSSLL
jgi:hypothetical protein